ncbi:MAG TPA: hypothetical protein VGI70_08825, partial [Polyangiales bacterium]
FAAHVVAVPLIALYVICSLDARRPLLAGGALALCLATRPSTFALGLLFPLEALAADGGVHGIDWRRLLRRCAIFAAPIAIVLAIEWTLNDLRFGDPFEVGYRYLRIRWSARIEKWGLFNYHYLSKNLAVFLAALPWLSASMPYLRISRHGLAIWFTTPNYLWTLWPKRTSATYRALAIAAGATAFVDLLYQNSGWIQFAYRFSLDYSVLLVALLAIGGRRFGIAFYALLVCACAINLFGAITFDRALQFYDADASQQVIFQPD